VIITLTYRLKCTQNLEKLQLGQRHYLLSMRRKNFQSLNLLVRTFFLEKMLPVRLLVGNHLRISPIDRICDPILENQSFLKFRYL